MFNGGKSQFYKYCDTQILLNLPNQPKSAIIHALPPIIVTIVVLSFLYYNEIL